MRNLWEVNVRRGWAFGLGIVIFLVGATIALVVWAAVQPISIWTFLKSLGALALLALSIWVVYQLWGLTNASYEMDRNAVVIHWGSIDYQIPMASVQAVFSGAELKGLRMRPGLRWPGHFVGTGATDDAGMVLFYATQPRERTVVIRTAGMAYAISPDDMEEFLQAFKERLEMGPTQEVEEHSTHPSFLDWEIWRDRIGMLTLSGSMILLVLLVGLLCLSYPYLPEDLVLRFTSQSEPLLVVKTPRIFYLPLVGTIFLLLNSTLGFLLYHRERLACYLLWIGLLVVQSGLWTAVLTILLRQ
ncbi:MAG: PH domain-containing protein [Anaerolineae bacterium]|nr:PH domain-containing protein [Anaerolineae bacterium]